MKAAAAPALVNLRSGPRWFLSLVSLALLVATIAVMAARAGGRRTWGAALDARSAAAETASVIEDNPEAALILAEAIVETLPRDGAPAPAAQEASRFVFIALEGRPGSALARRVLGQATVAGEGPRLWARPFELAQSAAPGLHFGRDELARRYLAAWATLSPEDREKGKAALGEAFRDPGFLQASLRPASAILGPDLAIQILPSDPASLDLAARILQGAGNGRAAELLAERRKAASRTAP